MVDKPRYSRISDILELLILMQSKMFGITLNDISKRLNVSRRTAERLRDAILDILPQIEEIETNEKEKHWGFTSGYMNGIISFTADEIAILEAVKDELQVEFKQKTLEKILTKLKALSRKQNVKIDDAIELILKSEGMAVVQKPGFKIDVKNIDMIRQAIKENRKIKAKYNQKKKVLAPWGLIYGSNIYLIGVEGNWVKPYVYSLHKLSDIEIIDETFDKGNFDIKEYINRSFGVYHNKIMNVELLFSKEVAYDVLNYNFHPTQKIKENKDGTVTLKFKASGELEILWHVFKWGENVKIITPKKLKQMYIDYLENVLKVQRN